MSLAPTTQAKLAIALVDPAAALDLVTNINTPTPAATTITATNANALVVGQAGTTNPAFQVDTSTASSATGIKVKSAAAAAGVAVSVISSGTNESVTLDAAGTGAIKLNSVGGTGAVQIGGAASGANAAGITFTPQAAGTAPAMAVVSTGANESLTVDAKGTGAVTIGGVSTGLIVLGRGANKGVVESFLKTTNSTAGSITATAAQLLGGYLLHTGTVGTITTDTGTNLDAAIPGVAVGDAFACIILPTAGDTFAGGTGVTVKGNSTLVAGKAAWVYFIRTGVATWDAVVTVSA